MKKFLKIMAIIIVCLTLLGGAAVYIIFSISKEDREIASNFVTYSSDGRYEKASNLMHDALKKEFPLTRFEEVFKSTKPYVETSFSSISMENSVTILQGITRTEDGCSSKVNFEILDDKIVKFNISPLCNE
tara:strand:+ start:303 stop:695 length:393 start_codon:yes stop_codon:yes gene_type:complete